MSQLFPGSSATSTPRFSTIFFEIGESLLRFSMEPAVIFSSEHLAIGSTAEHLLQQRGPHRLNLAMEVRRVASRHQCVSVRWVGAESREHRHFGFRPGNAPLHGCYS